MSIFKIFFYLLLLLVLCRFRDNFLVPRQFTRDPRTRLLEYVQYTVQSRFFEPPRLVKIGLKNRIFCEIGSKMTVLDRWQETAT